MDPQHRAEWLAHWHRHATHLPTPCSPPSPTAPSKHNPNAYLKGSTDSYFRGTPSRTCVKSKTPASKKLTWASPIAHTSTSAIRAACAVQRSSAVKEVLAEYATKHLDTVSQAMGIYKGTLLDGFKDYEDEKPASQRQLFVLSQFSKPAKHGALCTCVSCKERAYERRQASYGLQDTSILIQDNNFRKAAVSGDLDWALKTAEKARYESGFSSGMLRRQYSYEEISRHGSPYSPACCAQSPTHSTFSAAAQKLAFPSPTYTTNGYRPVAMYEQPTNYADSNFTTPTKRAHTSKVSKSCGPAWRIPAQWAKERQDMDLETSSDSETEQPNIIARSTRANQSHTLHTAGRSRKFLQHKTTGTKPLLSASKKMFKPLTTGSHPNSSDSDSDSEDESRNGVNVTSGQPATPVRKGPAFLKQAKHLFSTSRKERPITINVNSSSTVKTCQNRSPTRPRPSPQPRRTVPTLQARKTASVMRSMNLSYSSSDDEDSQVLAKRQQHPQLSRKNVEQSRPRPDRSPQGSERKGQSGKSPTINERRPAKAEFNVDVWSDDDSIDVRSRSQSPTASARQRHARSDGQHVAGRTFYSRHAREIGLADSSSDEDCPSPAAQGKRVVLTPRPKHSQGHAANPLIAKRADKLLLQEVKV